MNDELESCSIISMCIALVTKQVNNKPHRFCSALPPLVRRNATNQGPKVSTPTYEKGGLGLQRFAGRSGIFWKIWHFLLVEFTTKSAA